MKTLVLSVFALVAATLSSNAMASANDMAGRQFVLCESYNYQFNQCPVRGYIRGADLASQRSSAPCIFGQSWGINGNTIWVSNGCRGTFVVYTRY